MPAAKPKYYSTLDIQTILGISRTSANNLMHMFDGRGQMLRFENTMRVKIKDFEAWEIERTTGRKESAYA